MQLHKIKLTGAQMVDVARVLNAEIDRLDADYKAEDRSYAGVRRAKIDEKIRNLEALRREFRLPPAYEKEAN